MIVLFTDFGLAGPYLGQMRAAIWRLAPEVPVVDLFADAPAFDPKAAAYLLAAYAPTFPEDSVFLCVVDPGVGGGRAALMIEADARRYVGPDNGIFALVARRATHAQAWEITWRPERLSATFHGRDLFAPVAARLARGECPAATPRPLPAEDWPDDLPEIVYIDGFGNAMTGLRAASLPATAALRAGGRDLGRARTYAEVAPGEAFWYENANGLAEIAVTRGRADTALGLGVGDAVEILAG